MWTVALCVIALVIVKISHWFYFYRWSNPKFTGKLPPGSMGFPIIGETLAFFETYPFDEIPPFIKKRMSKYGPLFRTSILGSNTVVSTDPEVNFEIFRQENKSFVQGYPDGFTKIFGKDNLFFEQGNYHKYTRDLTLQLFGTEGLKRRFIHDMDRATRELLKSKAKGGVFDPKDAVTSMILGYMTKKVISDIEPETRSTLIESFKALNLNWFGSFVSLSAWKALYNCTVARGNAIKAIKGILRRRKASREIYGDFLDTIIGELGKQGTILSEATVIELIFLILVVSHDSISAALALAVKFISENPRVLAELKREHEAILKNRADKETGVTWEEYKSMMTFTHMFINELLRLPSTAPVMFRKAMNDVEINGYTIPKGWIVLVAPSVVHCDPKIYENPKEFNPWRWEGKEVLSGSKTFMAFGGGARLCVGAQFARLQIAIFLHYIATDYKISVIEEGEIIRSPLLQFSKGLRIKIYETCK